MEERVISLKKGKTISLKKEMSNGKEYKYAFVGLKWGKIMIPGTSKKVGERKETVVEYTGNFFQRLLKIGPKKMVEKVVDEGYLYRTMARVKDVDLDSSILIYDENKKLVDIVYYHNKKDGSGKIVHFGDDRAGGSKAKDADNEIISLKLSDLPSNYKYLVVILNSYTHEKFDELPYIKMRIYSSEVSSPYVSQETLAEFNLDSSVEVFKGKEALVLGTFIRRGASEWDFKAISNFTTERSISEMSKGSGLDAIKNL